MKCIKMLGLVALASLATMAFVGAGSASATTLCKKNGGEECAAGDRVSLPTTINASAAPVWFAKAIGKYTEYGCTTSEMGLKIEKSLGVGKGLSGQVTSLSFKGCVLAGCLGPEASNLPYHAEIHESANENGTLTLSNGGSGKPTLKFTGCLGREEHNATCIYDAEKLELGFEGAVPSALITATTEWLDLTSASESSGCGVPNHLEMTTSYTIPGQTFTASASKLDIVNSSNKTLVTCGSGMSGSLSGTISGFTLSGCTSEYTCNTGKALNLPYSTNYVSTGPGAGTLEISGLLWEISGCVLGTKCKFAGSETLSLDVKNNNELVASKEPLKQEGCLYIPSSTFWNATYWMKGPLLAVVANP